MLDHRPGRGGARSCAGCRAAGLAALVAHQGEVGDLVAAMLRDPHVAGSAGGESAVRGVDLGALPADRAAELSTALMAVADRALAAATVLAGHVVSSTGPGTGSLIAGTYASPKRWLEVEADLARPLPGRCWRVPATFASTGRSCRTPGSRARSPVTRSESSPRA